MSEVQAGDPHEPSAKNKGIRGNANRMACLQCNDQDKVGVDNAGSGDASASRTPSSSGAGSIDPPGSPAADGP